MVVVAVIELVAFVTVVWLLLRHHADQAAAWAVERRGLLNRIQHPQLVPVADRELFESPDQRPDEWAQVGQIRIADDYGLGDED